jgi:NADH-quinone oxidoreductase subunit E
VSHRLNHVELDELIDRLLQHHNSESSSPLIPILQAIQREQGYLSKDALRLVSEKTGASLSHVYGVATFYHQFRLKPEGKHQISICRGTACHVAGVSDLYNILVKELDIDPPEDTSKDGLFTLHEVRCLGACSLAPVIKVDETVYGKLTQKKLQNILKQYREDKP